jgi:hypothetical protein
MLSASFATSAPAAEAPSQDQDRIEKLEKRVQELEARVQQLESLVKALQAGSAMDKATLKAKEKICADNLRQLWVLETTYMGQFGGRSKSMPDASGPAFWLALTKTQPALLEESELDALVCPLSGKKAKTGFTTYRGPARWLGKLEWDDPVGCCEPGHHPDGTITILKKNGDVVTAGPEDPVYKKAMLTTTTEPSAPAKR